ncbi:hypothetical protein BJX99DRAFT_242032 [Aspergillus californicus]
MRLSQRFLSIAISFISLSSVALSYSPQLEILYWPVANTEPSVLAHVSYNPTSLESDLIDYSLPKDLSTGLARVGFYIATPTNPKQWVGSLTSLSALRGDDSQKPILRLHMNPSSEVYYVSIGSDSLITPTASASSPLDNLHLELLTDEPGPSPHLNRPVVLRQDGKPSEAEPEKTLFQKYWWVLLIVTFLAMSGGGEQQ